MGDACYMRCRSHVGARKRAYRTFSEAQQAAEQRGWSVSIYACPWRVGRYHITHKTEGDR
jgi:hypothetical protein